MNYKSVLLNEYRKFNGSDPVAMEAMPLSGSDRRYFRFVGDNKTVLGVYNPNRDENRTFIGFTYHFRSMGLPVPDIIYQNLEADVYFTKDLGDVNLFTWLQERGHNDYFDEEAVELYKRVIDRLIEFQVNGIKDLDTSLCYPHRSFDQQSMMWDLNYFKYMFLKLLPVSFNEKRLEKDFSSLTAFLLMAGQDYFLYRDFQSANIMIVQGDPWFIDYQGGRMGAAQYDAVSLLYDSKAHIPQQVREILLDYYIEKFCAFTASDRSEFRRYIPGFTLIRLMQALGAFGYRGLYEQKPGFVQSIIPAVKDLSSILISDSLELELPELTAVVESLIATDRFDSLKEPETLRITLNSFSYRNGLPIDRVHGGGYIFDCRSLDGPAKLEGFRDSSGLDQNVKNFMDSDQNAASFLGNSLGLIFASIDSYKRKTYTSLSVSFGSTAGQHRSVYCVEMLAQKLREIEGIELVVMHRDIQL